MNIDLTALNNSMNKLDAHNAAEFQKRCEYNAVCTVAQQEADKRGYTGMAATMFVHGFKRHNPKNVKPRQYGLEAEFKEGRACAVTPEIKRAIRIAAVEERQASATNAPAPVSVSFGASANGE